MRIVVGQSLTECRINGFYRHHAEYTPDSMGTTIGSTSDSDTFVSRHPILGAISLAIVFAGIAGAVAFGYVTALATLGLHPRSDALAVVGIIADLLLASGVIALYLRQGAALEEGLQTLKERTTHSQQRTEHENVRKERKREIKALQQQTETLREGMKVLAEQQRVQRSLYTPSLEIERFQTTDSKDSPDTIRFTITNLSAGDATNLTVRSDVSLIDAPEGYSVSGTHATCPLTRADPGRNSDHVPSRAEEIDFETDVVVGVGEATNEKDSVVCGFSDSMRVFSDDGVERVGLSLELVYEDAFGDEYTEQIRRTRIDLTTEPTLSDVLRMDSGQGSSLGESTNGWFQQPPILTSSEH